MKTGKHGKLALVVLTAVLGVGGAAYGQSTQPNSGQGEKKNEPLHPPTPSKPDDPPVYMSYITGALLIGLMALAALIPSKRGHQD